jgi:hypothetical protein
LIRSARERAHGHAGTQKLIDDEAPDAARCTRDEDGAGARHERHGQKSGRQGTADTRRDVRRNDLS